MSGLRFKAGDLVSYHGRLAKVAWVEDPPVDHMPYRVEVSDGRFVWSSDSNLAPREAAEPAALEVPPAPDLAQAIADRDAALADRDRWELRARRLGWDRD